MASWVRVQNICRDAEENANPKIFDNENYNYASYRENVIEYQQLLQSGGCTEFEQYIKNMNIYPYFHHDPFREVYEYRKFHNPDAACKLNYAKKMLALQQKTKTEKNKEKKAAAIWQYAIALIRSVSAGESWALTEYGLGDPYDLYGHYHYNARQKVIVKRSKKLIEQAGKTMKNSRNPAIRAKYDWYKNVDYSYEWRTNKSYQNFAEKYDFSVLQPFLSECDAFNSYFIPQYVNEIWSY